MKTPKRLSEAERDACDALTAKLGPMMRPYPEKEEDAFPMYSWARPAHDFWRGFLCALRARGFDEAQSVAILQSKLIRYLFDGEEAVERLGRALAVRLLRNDARHVADLLREVGKAIPECARYGTVSRLGRGLDALDGCKVTRVLSAKGRRISKARAILRASCPPGFELLETRINPGGIAVAGEASALYRRRARLIDATCHECGRVFEGERLLVCPDDSCPAVIVYAYLDGNGSGYVRREAREKGRATRYGRNRSIEYVTSLSFGDASRRAFESKIRALIVDAARDSFTN